MTSFIWITYTSNLDFDVHMYLLRISLLCNQDKQFTRIMLKLVVLIEAMMTQVNKLGKI